MPDSDLEASDDLSQATMDSSPAVAVPGDEYEVIGTEPFSVVLPLPPRLVPLGTS